MQLRMSRRTRAADAGGSLTEGTGLGGVPLLSFEADSPDKPPQKTQRLFNIYCFLFLKLACRTCVIYGLVQMSVLVLQCDMRYS